jgi:hypothetical protein
VTGLVVVFAGFLYSLDFAVAFWWFFSDFLADFCGSGGHDKAPKRCASGPVVQGLDGCGGDLG